LILLVTVTQQRIRAPERVLSVSREQGSAAEAARQAARTIQVNSMISKIRSEVWPMWVQPEPQAAAVSSMLKSLIRRIVKAIS
jgi:hypothetical protein